MLTHIFNYDTYRTSCFINERIMPIFTLAIGVAITAWVGIMGATAMLRTEVENKWFGEMLEQSPALMMVNGFGLFVTAALVGFNLLVPAIVTATFVKWALVGIGVSQLSTLFMQLRGGASSAAMAGPAVLLVLAVIYWFIRT
jgi:phosphohistidine swiveling domain-containing protein